MAERPLYTLYKNLKAQNYDVPDDYNKFESALTRDGKGGADNRHAIYENLKAQNFDVPSTYERFYSALFEPRSKTSSRAKGGSVPMSAADRARFSAGAAAISASAQQTMNNAGRNNRLKQRKQKQQKDFGRVNLGTHQTPFGGDANNVVKDDFAYNPETGKAGAYVTSDNENVYSLPEAEQSQAQDVAYQNAVDTGEIPSVFDVRDKNGNYDLQENINKNGTYLTEEGVQKQFDKKLEDAYARKKEIEDAIAEDHRLHGNPLLSYGASIGASNGRTAEQSDYSNKLATSLALVKQQIGALEAVKQYPTSSWGEDALKALDNTAFTAKTWDFGLTDFATMGQMERIKTKMDNNIPLSGSDKMLLKSKLGADAAAALEDEKMGNIYRWTKIAGQSLPFMADFFLTGGYGGITKGISRGALKSAAKRGMGKVSAAILKNTGIVAGDVIGSYAMAGTEQALKTGADIMQRHLGNLYQDEKGDYKFGTFDENGNLLHEGGESMGTALYKGLTSAMVENYTEKLFGHNYGIKKGAVNFMEKHGMNASAEFFKNIGKSGWYTNSKKWMEKFGINGFAEEVMEEEIGIPLHALLDGEGKVSDLLDAKQQLDIIGGMAISVGSMYAMGAGSRPVKGIYNRAQYYRFRNKVNVADSDAQNLIGDSWADIKDKIDNATNEQMGSVLAGILRQRDTMTKEQINAAVNYGINLMKMRGYNIAKTAEMNAREITNEPTTHEEQHQADVDNAYSEGHDADDADKHDIQIQQEDQMKTLAAALGISEQQLSAMSDEELESLTGKDDKLDQAIYEYQLSSARYQGVVDDAQDKVDLAAHQAEQRVDMYTDQSRGSVRNATIKASGGLEDYGVYIISGNIATHDDGSIDVSNSDDMILYYDPTTNSVEHADATMFAELGEELPADDVKAQAVADAKENAIKEVAGIIDGTVEVGSQFNVTDADGTEHTYEVLADYGDGTAAISIDGNVVENPYQLADLQQMKDLEDQKRLETAKAEREKMEKERAAQQNQETEQNQPSFDFNQILNDNGSVVLVDVLDKDGNTKYPNSQLFLIRDSGAKAKVVELKSDGTLVPHAVNKKDVRTATKMTLDEYKQAFAESSMIEDNSGENRGEIEVDTPTIEGDTVSPAEETAAPESAETPATEQTPEQTPAMTLEDGTIVPMLEDGNPDFSKLTASQTAELYESQFGEDADSVISSWVSDAKKALDKASNMTVKGKNFVEQKAAKDAKEKAIADAQAAYDSAIAIRDAYNERQLDKVEDTPEGRRNLIEKARRKFSRLKSAVKDDAEAVSQLYRDTVGSLMHRLYDSTGIDVTDTVPLTAEEYVASNLGAHSLNYEGTETSKGVKQETGLNREDFAKTQLLAADGKGTTIDALIHSLWENRPSNLESLDTQDIRNALIGVLTSGFKASEARNFVENIRIAQAENILEEQKRAQENADYAEQQKAEQEAELEAKSDEKAESEAKSKAKLDNESSNESNDLNNDLDNEKTNDKINDNINVPDDATDENPLGAQRDESDLPFSAKENGKQQTTAERAADVEKNKVDDMKVVDNIIGQKTRKAFERLAKMMGAEIQWQYSDKLGNGWIQETTDADGNVHRTIFITLDSSIMEGAQFIFGHEMTHQIKNLNPAAYNELTQLVLDTYGSDAFDKAVDETMKRYSDAGFSGRARDYYAEEVVADAVGEMIRDLNLAHTLAMKMSHPLLAAIHEILQKIKLAFFGTEYSDVTNNIIRSIEQAYVKTANGQVTNSETGEDVSYSLRQKPEPKKKGIGYKVFVLKDGKLYPPMVANPDGAATPVGVWLDADAAPIAGESKTGRPQVKQGGKGTQGGSGKLAYRPGWHLGVVPYAIQFNRKDAEGNKTLFPKNFVFAEVEYAADVDYQEEARQEGINPSGKYQHSLAGLKHLPTDGYYMYRTNPNPETDPWVITGAMKVNRILTRAEQAELVKNAGREPQQIQDGDIVTDDVVNSINQEIADAPKFSLKVYHGSGADFTEFDFDHMGEGAGSQVFGWGGYVTSSEEIGKSYTRLAAQSNGLKREGLKSNISRAQERLPFMRDGEYKTELENEIKQWQEELANIDESKNLYEVDIPDDNGSNYLEWYGDVPSNLDKEKLAELILDKTGAKEKVARFKATPAYLKALEFDIKNRINEAKTGQKLYTNISSFVGEKDASKILSALGFTGIKYPAGTIIGGAEEGDTNYVIFKPEDMKITQHTKFSLRLKSAIEETETNPSDAQKESGNYKKGHIKFGGYDYTIENPKGSTRSGKDADGKEWKVTMHDTYGYIRGKFGKDGDHLDMFINDKADLDNWNGDVFVVDQVNPDGSFDEHKVMYGYYSMDDAKNAYLANYSDGWQGLGNITGVSKDEFDKWLDTSNRKLKPFADYAKVKFSQAQSVAEPRYSLKDEKTMFGMHNISLDKLRKAIKQGGFAAPSMGVIDSKNGIYSDYGEITLIPKAEKLAKSKGKNAGTFTADAWTPVYPKVEKIMTKQGEKAFNADMNKLYENVDVSIWSNIKDSWKPYLLNGDIRDGLYFQFLQEKGMKPEVVRQKGKYDKSVWEKIESIVGADGVNKTELSDTEVSELLKLMNEVTGEDNSVEGQRKALEAEKKDAEKQGNALLIGLLNRRIARLDGEEDYWIADGFMREVSKDISRNGKVKVLDSISTARQKVVEDDKLAAEFNSWLDKKSEQYEAEEMLYNGTTPTGKPKYIPNTIENAVKLMKKHGLVGGYNTFHPGVGAFIAKLSPQVNTLAAMKKAKDKLIPFGDERHNEVRDKILKEHRELARDLQIGESAWDDSGEYRMQELAEVKPNDLKGYIKRNWKKDVSDDWVERYNDLVNTIKNDYPVYYFETKFMRPYGLDEFEKAIVPSDTPSDVVDALKKAGIDVSSYERGNAEDRQKVTMDAINSSDNIRFSLKAEKEKIVADAKANGTYMTAPNGDKTKLDAEQWATVRTTNFKNWFGDWENDPENASKVVDENGEPMVVWHGRSAEFNTFEKKEGVRFIMGLEDKVKAEGFFFSPDKGLAEEFASNSSRHRGGKANVVPCFLNIRKPMDLTGEDYDRIYEDVTGWEYMVGMDTQDNLWGIMDEEGMADKIKEKGYDGAIFVEEVDDSYEPTKISYCALDANQIKSAENNNGDFSSDNNDIRFSLAGERGAAAADKAEERTTRMDFLSVARKMEEEKKDAKSIKIATGWERGADGKWRFEIPDFHFNYEKWKDNNKEILDSMDDKDYRNVMRYEKEFYEDLSPIRKKNFDELRSRTGYKIKQELTLGDVLEGKGADNLFKYYPELRGVKFKFSNLGAATLGIYNSNTNTIEVNDAFLYSPRKAERNLQHEVQHVIQHLEGFAKGGNEFQVRGEVKKKFSEVIKQIRQLRAEGKEDEAKAIVEKNRGLYNAYTKNDDYNSYKSLAGEVEARNVQERMNMTSEERRKTLAESTEDVARKDQIFLGVGDVSFSLRDMADGKESGVADMAEDLKSLNTPDEVDDAIKTAIDDMPSGWKMANKKIIHIAQALGENRKAEIAGEEPKFSIRTYHGTGAKFDKFDLSHALEGEGSETFGHGVYVTNSSKIGREYAQRAKQRKMADLYKNMRYPDGVKGDIFKRRVFGEMVNDVATGGSVASAKEFAKKRVGADANDIQRTLENLKDREKGTEYEQNLKDRLAEYKEGLKWIDSLDEDYLTQGNANRYDVDIPDDNGSNYLDWENPMSEEQINAIRDALSKNGVDVPSWEKRGFNLDLPFKKVYSVVLPMMMRYKPEDVSKFLSSIGFTGIKYPAGMIHGGAKEGDYNYVIFDENNANIVGNTRFSLRYDKFEHDLNQWKKDNNLPKDAKRPTIPQRNAGESAVDFLRRVDEYRKQMALWKTAPTYEQHLLSDDTALGEFNRELQRGSVLKRIAFQDSMLAIRKAQEAIMKEVGVDRLNMAEDAYTAENRSHGKGKNEFEEYNNEFLQPLRKAYHQMKKVLGDSYDNVRIYMMAKHGLERDAQMAFKMSLDADYEDVAQRSAAYKAYKGDMNRIINDSDLEFGRVDFTTWRQRDNALRAKYSPSYMNYRYDKNGIVYDYSGLSSLFDGSDFEEAAYKLVKDIEDKYVTETHNLWDATNAATKKILRDGYKAGMMSKDTYQYVRDMYSHYIPLRGWDGTTADQVWDYVGGGKGAFNQTLKTAHGRTSIADDPIAYIENMAESGILLNNKNWVKQHLMLLAQNHPTSLLTLSKAWYVKSVDANGNEEWIPATPQITSQMNSNQVKSAIDAFEKKMEQMAQTGDATQKRDGLNIAYPQTHSEEREHEVRVMKDGEEYVIYVNGDPQLAQAMNNTRAHRVREIQSGKLDRAAAWLGRKMAAAYTSLSPLFIPSNYFRDLTMTLASTAIREDAKYNYLLRKNLATSWNLGFMLRDYQNGKLRDKVNNGNATPKEQMFYDFMMNGGETGFVSSLDVEDLKKKFKNDLKDLDRRKANLVKVGHTIMDSIEFLNRAIEDSNRFAVYMTSIQYGRSIDEAVNDAKDVTLNFNRKGTGEYGWQMIRNLYLFINPAVQSLQTLGALAKHHPFKFTAVTASWLASGVLVPIVNAALMSLFGGDDDKDKYWQFSKWDRRNNFIMWIPTTNEFVKIPLAQEFRAFYGFGDMIASKMMGGDLAEESWSQYAEDLLGQVVDMLPLDPTGYDGNIAVSLMPNPIRPIFELAFNVDFTGKPLFKETEYNKYDPNFTKAYVGTPDWLVRASRMVNSIGNDYPDVQQNSIDAFGDPRYNLNNPAVVDHVLSSYLGGAYTMGSQVLGLLTKSLNDRKEIKVADIPLFSKFVSNPDDRPVSKKQGDEFWDMKENHDRAANTLSKLKKQAKVDGDYSMLERFYGSDEYKQYKQDDVKVKKYEEDKKKERAEESGEEYRPHKLNAEDIYKAHATPKDDFEDLKLKQLYTKLNGFKTSYDLLVDTAPSQSDGYYNTNKAAIDAIDEISLDKQDISELKKGFLDDGKDAYNAEDMKQIRYLRKKILAVLENANKVVVANQKANTDK